MKKTTWILIIFLILIQSEAFSQSNMPGEAIKKNTIGFSFLSVYPVDIQSAGIGAETIFRHSLNKYFFYTISLGYVVAYHENPGGRQYTYAITASTLDHYAHYMLNTSLGINFLQSEKHQAGCSLGLSGRYSSEMYFRYAYIDLLDDSPEYHFIPEMVEGYDIGLLTEISYSWLFTNQIGLRINARYIAFSKFTNILTAGAGIFYRF